MKMEVVRGKYGNGKIIKAPHRWWEAKKEREKYA